MESQLSELLNNPSGLGRTWFFDIDGTLLKHNGWLDDPDELLPGVREFFDQLPVTDVVVLTTARSGFLHRQQTLDFLRDNNIRFNYAIFDLPVGERIVVNDIKPHGLHTAIGVNVKRNKGLN